MKSLKTVCRSASSVFALGQATLGPWFDLLVRLWIAQAFVVLALMRMMGGAGASASIDPRWWAGALQSLAASNIGAIVQALCPLLLAAGLLSRVAAAGLLVQVCLLAGPDLSPDARLFWTVLLLRVLLQGSGPISLDRLLGRGVTSLALPWIGAVARVYAAIASRSDPIYLLGVRIWLAAAPAAVAIGESAGHQWLPHMPGMVGRLGSGGEAFVAVLLAVGLATRATAIALLGLVPFGDIAATGDVRLPWALVLGLLALFGGGSISLDGLLKRWARRPLADRASEVKPHVVVVGGGFGGLAAVRGLRDAACRVTLIDRRNHHLFQPLLYQVATAGLSPSDIAVPVRGLFRSQDNLRIVLGEVTGVDPAGRSVTVRGERIAYDWLVLATGARHSYFGRDEWAPVAPGLKSIEDGTAIRRRLLLAFEEAESAATDADRTAWLTFVVVGGGPTGVELAGAIAELARHGLTGEFRRIDPTSARVMLVQSGPRLLPAFPEALSHEAERALTRLGVEVCLDRKVDHVDAEGVTMAGVPLAARTVLWAAGVMASPAARWLGVTADRAGRVPVGADLSVPGCERVFAIGDTAASKGWAGKEVPGLAPAAKQGGAYVARVVRSKLEGRAAPKPFRYRHFGSLATIGRQSAVADFGWLRLRGAVAWWVWGAAHIAFLVGGRNRVLVLIQWVWAYLTFRRGTRLITEAR